MPKQQKEPKERVLTERERVRTDHVAEMTEQMTADGYTRRQITYSIAQANAWALLTALPLIAVFGAWFVCKWGASALLGFGLIEGILVIVMMFALIIVHEGLHGLTWAIFSPLHLRQVEFGFIREQLTPYCYCGAALRRPAYLLGSFMPCLILGILPCVVACLLCLPALLYLGFTMILAAGGDLLIIDRLLITRRKGRELLCIDHPTECGLILFER